MQEKLNILDGWKTIEAYTGKTRFIMKRNSYPIHKRHGRVYAFPDEIEEFMRTGEWLGVPPRLSRHAVNVAPAPAPKKKTLIKADQYSLL